MAFISKRLSKVYPAYFTWFLLDIPGTTVSTKEICPLFWLAIASQPVILHSWLGCQHIAISNGVGWYLCTLFWLWCLYPFLQPKRLFASMVWPKILGLYVLSLAGWAAFYQFSVVYTRAVPLLRLCEFLMGCGAVFTLDRPLNGWGVLLAALTFPVYCAFTFEMPGLWGSGGLNGSCQLWPPRAQPEINPTIFLSKFALPWCLVIHYLAATELSGACLAPLHWDCFKSLSGFSLHAYLSHYTVACALRTVSNWLGSFTGGASTQCC